MQDSLNLHEKLKISCLSRGIVISPLARDEISNNGSNPLSIHEFATTGGVTFKLDDIYINAPFDEWYCESPEVFLDFDQDQNLFFILFQNQKFFVDVLPLPGFLNQKDNEGNYLKEVLMSHADRLRISPISGCSFGCHFCDFGLKQHQAHPIPQVMDSMSLSLSDKQLPIKHILISGGTPTPSEYPYYERICEEVIINSNIPVDIMLAPCAKDILLNLFYAGANGFAINIEIFDRDIAQKIMPNKWSLGLSKYAEFISKAVELTNGNGKVRSLIIVGLEPIEKTLEGVEFLAKLGCDPVLSPFRPAKDTPLQNFRPPSISFLEEVYLKSLEIVEKYNVKLGPRCIPCQHNTLSFPSGDSFFYS